MHIFNSLGIYYVSRLFQLLRDLIFDNAQFMQSGSVIFLFLRKSIKCLLKARVLWMKDIIWISIVSWASMEVSWHLKLLEFIYINFPVITSWYQSRRSCDMVEGTWLSQLSKTVNNLQGVITALKEEQFRHDMLIEGVL
jgi:hypothetical protein